MSDEIEQQITETPKSGVELPLPGRRESFEDAADATFAQYDEALRRLADAS